MGIPGQKQGEIGKEKVLGGEVVEFPKLEAVLE